MTAGGPLAGIRVLDMGIITAGAATSQVFADFGADVIKVESTTYMDSFRRWTQIPGGGGDINDSPPFRSVNRGKRGIAIDLKTESGRETFLALVKVSDLVVENFRRGVLERLGIGFETLRTANPRIVLLSLSSQGLDGPESGYLSYGSPLEALGGLMAITGYGVGDPLWTGSNVNYPDQLVSIVAPGFALAGLRERDRTGEAVHVDAAQREAVTSGVGDTIVEVTTSGRVAVPIGNRDKRIAPQGVYPTTGDDQWIAISVQSDEAWVSLCDVLGLEGLRDDPELATADGRRAQHDRLDSVIGAATAPRDKFLLERRLQEAEVTVGAVATPHEVLQHPQLEALRVPIRVGGDNVVQRGVAARFSRTPGAVTRPAPRLGEHTREVLIELLGFDGTRVAELTDAGAIYCDPETAGAEPVASGSAAARKGD
ncbi:MAG: frc [Microbacteriaceae bacterium]|jgi:crotonobetainyl-CoA:carnitine CoA-transferase CaiB-like acyl-CoA transferase|nr:frc [Microbacteriaceae bacterium]